MCVDVYSTVGFGICVIKLAGRALRGHLNPMIFLLGVSDESDCTLALKLGLDKAKKMLP